jgi:hypothetical protein
LSDVCSTCKAPIRWVVTHAGHPMPIDPDPVGDGNLRLEPDAAGLPRVIVVPPAQRVDGEELYVAHFRTCPYADQHRRRR